MNVVYALYINVGGVQYLSFTNLTQPPITPNVGEIFYTAPPQGVTNAYRVTSRTYYERINLSLNRMDSQVTIDSLPVQLP